MLGSEAKHVNGYGGDSDAANNNNGSDEKPFSERKVKLNSQQQEAAKVYQKMPNETEDWHVLEVDNNNTNGEENLNSVNKNTKIQATTENGAEIPNPKSNSELGDKAKQYIDINPLGSIERYSPQLVYLCTALYASIPILSTITTFTLIYLLFTRFYPITLLYFTCIFLDRKTCNRGGRRVDFVFRSKFWSYLAAYFPIQLRHSKEFKLDPKKNYILNYSPHGIAAFGSVTGFSSNGLNLSEVFPGITTRFLVHETSFIMPIIREVFSLRGDCSVNSQSIDYLLGTKKTGNLLSIVVGGLAEADLSDSEVLKIVIAERKGFIKKALLHGANLIPCIAFGENSVFKRVDLQPSSLMYRLQSTWYELFKFKHPIYYGGSIISDELKGIMPYKRPITVVLGDPIEVERSERPTQQQIDELHAEYLEQLKGLYKDNKDLCSKYDKELVLV